jgi:hypothetical protein
LEIKLPDAREFIRNNFGLKTEPKIVVFLKIHLTPPLSLTRFNGGKYKREAIRDLHALRT